MTNSRQNQRSDRFQLEALEQRLLLSGEGMIDMSPELETASTSDSQAAAETFTAESTAPEQSPNNPYDPSESTPGLFEGVEQEEFLPNSEEVTDPLTPEPISPLAEENDAVQIQEQGVEIVASKLEGDDAEAGALIPEQPDLLSISDQLMDTLRSANGPPGLLEDFDFLTLTQDNDTLTL